MRVTTQLSLQKQRLLSHHRLGSVIRRTDHMRGESRAYRVCSPLVFSWLSVGNGSVYYVQFPNRQK